MTKLDLVRQEVAAVYASGDPNADVWVDWAYENHVLVVARIAEDLVNRHGGNPELAIAGALLHDIADVKMDRDTEGHEQESLRLANEILGRSGYSQEDIQTIMYEIIEPHSCSERAPTTLEGKIVASADGASHFMTDFYTYFCWQHYGPDENYELYKKWVLQKIEKDITKKIFFDDLKKNIVPKYEALKLVFGL